MPKIKISGVIIPNDYQELYDWLEIEGTSPRKVAEALESNANEDVDVEINSPGGDVWSGSAIYTMLKQHEKTVTVSIVGLAASAASVIAMAGDVVKMSPTAQFMCHNASGTLSGDKNDIESGLQKLKSADTAIKNAYIIKTGLSDVEVHEMMNKTTWLSANEAKEKGFVDQVMFEEKQDYAFTANYGNLPFSADKITELKSLMDKEKGAIANGGDASFLVAQSRLNLLKIRKEEK
ncbi:head maturation protease, ClpP-related [Brochothrix campestris]|uniref:ATP-dependent Clp protease proteolytic subunit n=1 Tax=Brochothrix campestris FSL F6-1037 TaxID=1265861 RepID=W7CYE7_9LIST|nr:head maturation protease, ClpP-related [Brochothrix campestris]EUJ41972.1 phage protein [Brochothrix campestris FSL F6-1037]